MESRKGVLIMRFIYPAVIRKTESGTFRADFPDLEDCHAEGDTLDEVLDNANEAAANWISVELELEGHLPPISEETDLSLKEGDLVRNICITMRMMDGWDE